MKDQKPNYGMPLDLRKRSSKIRDNFELIRYDKKDYDVTMDLQKKSFIESAESCPHWLKITLWKELGSLIERYKIAI